MIKFFDLAGIEKLSEKIHQQTRSKVESAISIALKQGAIQAHKNSTHLFADNPKRVCAHVVNNFFNKNNDSPSIVPLCKGMAYEVKLAMSNIITVWALPKEILNLIKSKKQPILKPKYYLLLIYRELYNPALLDSFTQNRALILSICKGDLKYSSQKSGGGFDLDLFKILKTEVFVGKKAINFYLNEPMEDFPYEVISDNVSKTIQTLKKNFPKLEFATEDFPILTDFTFSITKVTLDKKSSQRIIIYNSAEYELIPYVPADVRIGSVYVVCRFLLINIFVSKKMASKTAEFNRYFLEMHDLLIGKQFSDDYYVPAVENYYGYYQSEKTLFKNCGYENAYKPAFAKKEKGRLLYF